MSFKTYRFKIVYLEIPKEILKWFKKNEKDSGNRFGLCRLAYGVA